MNVLPVLRHNGGTMHLYIMLIDRYTQGQLGGISRSSDIYRAVFVKPDLYTPLSIINGFQKQFTDCCYFSHVHIIKNY